MAVRMRSRSGRGQAAERRRRLRPQLERGGHSDGLGPKLLHAHPPLLASVFHGSNVLGGHRLVVGRSRLQRRPQWIAGTLQDSGRRLNRFLRQLARGDEG
jgi:hypothetical protein